MYQKDVYILLRLPRGLEKTEKGGQRQNFTPLAVRVY
jgi:hypothetical protein